MGGIWEGFLDAIGWVLAFFYGIVPSYGIAIILLTITIRALLFPLTAKSARSMLMMQRVQPEIRRLQAQYKDDRQRLNEELMRFYKENKINPLGGCLPLVAQTPVFIALYNVLRNPQDHVPTSSDLFTAYCQPGTTISACAKNGLDFLSMNLSVSALGKHSGFWDALPYFVLVGLVVVTAFVQQRQSQRLTRGQNVNPQMQMIGKVLPFVFVPISLSLPAGIVLYFVVSNLWQIGQQELVYRTFGRKLIETPLGPIDAKSTETGKGGDGGGAKPKGFLASLREGPSPGKSSGAGKPGKSGNPAARSTKGTGRTTPPKPAKKSSGSGGSKSRKRRR